MSAKKAKKLTIKNLLLDPYTAHLPQISAEETARVHDALKALPTVKPPRPKVPWSLLKKASKEDRKTFRRDYQDEEMQIDVVSDVNLQKLRKCLYFGINEVTKLLETNSAAAVLVSTDVSPQFMIKHVSTLAALHKTPFLRVPDLRSTLRKQTGIATAALALKPHKQLSTLLKEIKKLSSKYRVPRDHALHADDKEESEEETVEIKNVESEIVEKDYYLRRGSGAERVFVPKGATVERRGFLALGFGTVEETKKDVEIGGYRGLKVKRMQNNNKRKRKGGKKN